MFFLRRKFEVDTARLTGPNGSGRFRGTRGDILGGGRRSPCTAISTTVSAERCWSGRTGLTANQFHPKRVTGVRIPPSPPDSAWCTIFPDMPRNETFESVSPEGSSKKL